MIFGRFPLLGSKMKGQEVSCLSPGCTWVSSQADLDTEAINLLVLLCAALPPSLGQREASLAWPGGELSVQKKLMDRLSGNTGRIL